MQGKYILFALIVILLFAAPGSASLNRIAANSPVFIGESNVDISTPLNGCHTISWWANGTDTSKGAAKNITLVPINTASPEIYQYTFDPALFSGYTGTWYCTDNQPPSPVFQLEDPSINISVWDLDHNQDVTGTTVPLTTNITYKIDTNLDAALNYTFRPNGNPTDSFYTVTLTDPTGRNVPTIYTGSYGAPTTVILTFDKNPFITASPYYWKNGAAWDRTARNIQGDVIYPPGTYTFTVTQNLNNMQGAYAAANITTDGKVTRSANVTFSSVVPIVTAAQVNTTAQVTTTAATTALPTLISPVTEVTTVPTSSPVAKKTTYASLPAMLAVAGIVGAALLAARRK